jgi:hypothetical protein
MIDIFWFPEPWLPVLKDYNNNASLNILQVNWINPQLTTGFLYHTTGTGAVSINNNLVTGFYSWDGLTYTSWSTGNVYLYLNTWTLANQFVPYTNATADVNIGTYSFYSQSGWTYSSDDYPNSSQFYLTYTPVNAYSIYAYCNGYVDYLYDTNNDWFLYDGSNNIQATIDYNTWYIDTTSYNYWTVNQISYSYTISGYTTQISYGGSTFWNWISAYKDNASYAGYFYDWNTETFLNDSTYSIRTTGTVAFGADIKLTYDWGGGYYHTISSWTISDPSWISIDWSNRKLYASDWTTEQLNWYNAWTVTTAQDIEVTDYTKWIILTSPNATRWRLTVSDLWGAIFTSL